MAAIISSRSGAAWPAKMAHSQTATNNGARRIERRRSDGGMFRERFSDYKVHIYKLVFDGHCAGAGCPSA